MKFKNKFTPIIFGLTIFASTALASFTPPFVGQAAAADPYGCSYKYSDSEKTEIARSGCENGISDSTYKLNDGDTPYEDTSVYTLAQNTSAYTSCTSTIKLGNGGTSGTLNGQVKTSAGCSKVPSGTTITIAAVSGPQDTDATITRKQAYLAFLSDRLQPIVNSRCVGLGNPTAADACIMKYSTALNTCFNKVFPKIDESSADANQKFANQFADCYANALSDVRPKITNSEVKSALGSTVYADMLAAGEQAVAAAEGETDGDLTCEGSAGPFGWFLCVIINGLQSLIGGLYDNIIKPLLITDPLSTDPSPSNGTYNAWKNFRIYGDVFLVIALLIIVFGESIGGGLIDAYTAKKVLPRLLIAAILINLSYYIVGVLIDIMNIVGNGIMALITAPFGLTGDFTLSIGGGGTTTMAGLLAGALVYAKVSLAGQFLPWLFFCVLLPMALIMLAIVATVLLRRALIVFLVIISPVAFALYCLPNTEKYFKQWWDMLFKTLLVYPIIAALFAMGKVSGYLLTHAGGSFVTDGIGDVLGIVALVIPLMLIPFSFKIAGGILGRAMDVTDGMRQRGHKFTEGTRQRISTQGNKNRIQSRQKYYSKLQEQGSKGGTFRRNTLGRAARMTNSVVGGYNIEAATSAARADTMKILNDQIATGADSEIRALTVNKRTSASRMNNGMRQFQTLGGAWVNEADVDAGYARWGNDTFAQQAALSYEMRKASTEEEVAGIAQNYSSIARGWGMDDQQAGGAWIGAAFEHQGDHLEYKHTNWKTGTIEGDNARKFVNEIYEKKGSYPMSQNGSHTIKALQDVYAQSGGDRDTQEKIQGIAEQFTYDRGMGGAGITPTGTGADDVQIRPIPGTGVVGGGRQTNAQGSAHFNERINELARMTGVAGPTGVEVSGQYTNPQENPQGGPTPTNTRLPGPEAGGGSGRSQKS